MAADELGCEECGVGQADRICPCAVKFVPAESFETRHHINGTNERIIRGLLTGDADQAVLSQRAGRPPLMPVLGEPVMSEVVMNVIGKEERHEHVHVQE